MKLHYVDWGNHEAPPLLLVHGGRDHCRSWDWVADRLRRDWHVMAPDLRGHGDSAWSPDGEYTMPAYVYDLASLIHQLGYPQLTIVSHSLGGSISLRYTGLFPDKVKKLVAIEGLGPSPAIMAQRLSKGVKERWPEWIEARRALSSRSSKRYVRFEDALARMRSVNKFLSEEQAQHLTAHGASRNEDLTWSWKFDNYMRVFSPLDLQPEQLQELWSAITCPTLLCYGDQSFASNPQKDGRLIYFQNARVVNFPQAGHWLHHDQLEMFMEEIGKFLKA